VGGLFSLETITFFMCRRFSISCSPIGPSFT
jgi:hypothetical protein